jgi:hypothetical protein
MPVKVRHSLMDAVAASWLLLAHFRGTKRRRRGCPIGCAKRFGGAIGEGATVAAQLHSYP